MLAIIENLIQMLYTYQQSVYYRLHFIAIIVVSFALAYIIFEERKIKNSEAERPVSKCSDKQSYFDFVTSKQKTTREALDKLEESKEYQDYLRERDNPKSKYYPRVEEDVSDIYLSDDSDDDRKRR